MTEGKKVTKEEQQEMLFWYTIYGGNYSQAAKKHSESYGVNRSRKVMRDVAERENFAVKAHLVRNRVNEYLFQASTGSSWETRMVKMGLDLLDIDEKVINHAKLFVSGKYQKSMFSTAAEMMAAIKQVTSDLANLGKEVNPKKAAFDRLDENEGTRVQLSLEQILKELPEEDAEDLRETLALRERNKLITGI